MPSYLLNGLWLDSDLVLRSLAPQPAAGAPRLGLRLSDAAEPPAVSAWLHERTRPGRSRPYLSVARAGTSYLLRVHGHADFLVDGHVAFAGPSRSGKSTLASGLGAPFALVCDDCVVVRLGAPEVSIWPSYPAARLLGDSAKALFAGRGPLVPVSPRTRHKVRVDLAPRTGLFELRRLYRLDPADQDPAIVPLSRRDALVELARHLHRLDPDDRSRLRAEFEQLEELVSRVPVARLLCRHRYEDLPRVAAAIEADLLSLGDPLAPGA
ncbi:MAG: hypothetical protein HY744_22585 [Deltaproteobacteria bacterium]|nr:hypothetical protein [Deltaproteobacteria bacterium]